LHEQLENQISQASAGRAMAQDDEAAGTLWVQITNLSGQMVVENKAFLGSMNIKTLKQMLQSVCLVSFFRQKLLLDGRVLRDNDILAVVASGAPRPLPLTLVVQSLSPELGNRLLEAAHRCDAFIVENFLKRSADPNCANQGRYTPLYMASERGGAEVISLLIEAGSKLSWALSNGMAAQHIAAQNGHVAVVKQLLEARADLEQATETGFTALYLSSMNGHRDVVQYLCEARANTEAASERGTSLNIASSNGHLEVVLLLSEAKADLHDENQKNMPSALHMASMKGHVDIVRFLVESGLDPSLPSVDGATPLHLAAMMGKLQVVQWLCEAGAEKDKRMHSGPTAWQLANHNGHVQVACYLQRVGSEVTWHWRLLAFFAQVAQHPCCARRRRD